MAIAIYRYLQFGLAVYFLFSFPLPAILLDNHSGDQDSVPKIGIIGQPLLHILEGFCFQSAGSPLSFSTTGKSIPLVLALSNA
jgi:hypothetical protein